jgi:hypothetical protein
MARHIAIYKRYHTHLNLEQGKDYQIISHKVAINHIKVTVINQAKESIDPVIYASEWEFLQDWQILRTWQGKR